MEESEYAKTSVDVTDVEMRDGYFAAVKKLLNKPGPYRSKTPTSFRFVLLNFTDYFVGNLEDGIPAEVGCVVFSLEEGIVREFSTLIDPKDKSLMTSVSARERENSHGLPPPMFEKWRDRYPLLKECSTSDYQSVLNQLEAFMMFANASLPAEYHLVCFAVKMQMELVEKCLDWIMQRVGYMNFKIYPAEELMTGLFGMIREDRRENNVFCGLRYQLSSKPERSPYRTMSELACRWHQQERLIALSYKCALHQTKDQMYRLLKGLLKGFLITPEKGVHYPAFEYKHNKVEPVVVKYLTTLEPKADHGETAVPSNMLRDIEDEMKLREFENQFVRQGVTGKRLNVGVGVTPALSQRSNSLESIKLHKANRKDEGKQCNKAEGVDTEDAASSGRPLVGRGRGRVMKDSPNPLFADELRLSRSFQNLGLKDKGNQK